MNTKSTWPAAVKVLAIHSLCTFTACPFAAVNISLGLTVFAELLDISALQNRPFWVWVASMVVYGAVDAAAFVHRLASRKRKEEQDKEALLLQKKTNEAPKVQSNYVSHSICL